MELVASVVLLGSFLVGVDALSGGGPGSAEPAGRMIGLFRHAADLAWPAGVQEETDSRRWAQGGDDMPCCSVADSPEISEGGTEPVPLARVPWDAVHVRAVR
jgi:hypothetical protein